MAAAGLRTGRPGCDPGGPTRRISFVRRLVLDSVCGSGPTPRSRGQSGAASDLDRRRRRGSGGLSAPANASGTGMGPRHVRSPGPLSITINTHGRIAGDDANNLRLFEATGMGTLLVTDARRNMGQLFKTGSEVVTYGDARDCAGVVRHFLDHPAEATAIAAAGQRRTMRDHTWANRMARLTELVMPRLRRR